VNYHDNAQCPYFQDYLQSLRSEKPSPVGDGVGLEGMCDYSCFSPVRAHTGGRPILGRRDMKEARQSERNMQARMDALPSTSSVQPLVEAMARFTRVGDALNRQAGLNKQSEGSNAEGSNARMDATAPGRGIIQAAVEKAFGTASSDTKERGLEALFSMDTGNVARAWSKVALAAIGPVVSIIHHEAKSLEQARDACEKLGIGSQRAEQPEQPKQPGEGKRLRREGPVLPGKKLLVTTGTVAGSNDVSGVHRAMTRLEGAQVKFARQMGSDKASDVVDRFQAVYTALETFMAESLQSVCGVNVAVGHMYPDEVSTVSHVKKLASIMAVQLQEIYDNPHEGWWTGISMEEIAAVAGKIDNVADSMERDAETATPRQLPSTGEGMHPAGTRVHVPVQLNAEEVQEVDHTIQHPPQSIRIDDIPGGSLRTLRSGAWLNDDMINAYLKLVHAQADSVRNGMGMQPLRAHVFSTFFMKKLKIMGYSYTDVRRWTRNVDIFALDTILVPINIGQGHWVLAVINMGEKRFEYFDPYHGDGSSYLCLLRRYLQDEHKDKKGADLDLSEWKDVHWGPKCIPSQTNGVDCGVFLCQFARAIMLNIAISFNQANAEAWRRIMLFEIARWTLK